MAFSASASTSSSFGGAFFLTFVGGSYLSTSGNESSFAWDTVYNTLVFCPNPPFCSPKLHLGSRRLCHECLRRIVLRFHLPLHLLVPTPPPDDPQRLAWASGAHRPQQNSSRGPKSSSVVCQEMLQFLHLWPVLGSTCYLWLQNYQCSVGKRSHRCHPESLFWSGNCPRLCERCVGCNACHQWRKTVLWSP